MLPTQAFHCFLSLLGGWEVCTAYTSEAVHRLSCTPGTLGQGKAVRELENRNAALPRDHSKTLQSQCRRQGVLWVCLEQEGNANYYSGVKLPSLSVIHGLSSGCGGQS